MIRRLIILLLIVGCDIVIEMESKGALRDVLKKTET